MNFDPRRIQEIQKKLKQLNEVMESKEFSATAGGGKVKAIVNGKGELTRIEILDESILQDKEMLEDIIVAAVNEAIQISKDETEKEYKRIVGINIPGLDISQFL